MKIKKKTSIHFTIDSIINEKLDKYIKTECINKSLLIQTLIEKYLDEKTQIK